MRKRKPKPQSPPLGELTSHQQGMMDGMELHCAPLSGDALLLRAAGRGHAAELAELMEAHPDKDLRFAAEWAAGNGRMDCLALALGRTGTDAFLPGAAHAAARNGHAEALRTLAGAADKAELTALMKPCCQGGHSQCLAILLAHPEADPLRPEAPDKAGSGMSAIQWACQYGWPDCSKLIVAWLKGKEPGDKDVLEHALAITACDGGSGDGRLRCMEIILPVCDPKAQRSRALRVACSDGRWEQALLLIPLSRLDDAPDDDGARAIDLAAAGPDSPDPAGSPGSVQREQADAKIVQALIEGGASVEPNLAGSSPLDAALAKGRSSVARILRSRVEALEIARAAGTASASAVPRL